jgi:hypothetical protein
MDTALVLLMNLSDNYLKHAQFNTVVVQQKEMDRVGVEPTTLASFLWRQFYPLEGQQL